MNELDKWLRGFSPTAKYEGEVDMDAATPQPAPRPGQDEVYKHVIADIHERVAAGEAKYGTKLMTHNGRDALMDAYQEALDLVMYLRQAIDERDCNKYPDGISVIPSTSEPGTEHELKTWPVYYNATISGDKPFEIRLNDRGFTVGDRLKLREFDPGNGYTGRWCRVVVTYVFEANMFASFGLLPGYVVMGIRPVEAAHE